MKSVLQKDLKLCILKGLIPEQHALTSKSEHNAWWKHYYDLEYLSDIILRTLFKPIQALQECKDEKNHLVCSKRPIVHEKDT